MVIQAGDGGIGAPGGSLTFVQVTEDADGVIVKAGSGGATDTAHRNAGRGGGVHRL